MRALRILIAVLVVPWACAAEPAPARPNIIVILADDLGLGDVRAFNPASKIPTPQLDRLARTGIKFMDAHAPSSVCTPTRYGLLTGRYAWRSKLQSGVLGGLSARLIEPGRLTIAQLLKDRGYATACIGKWHLGLDWVKKPGRMTNPLEVETAAQTDAVDFTQPFAGGPRTLGFDYFFGIAASLDMVPYTFLENDRCTVVPTKEMVFPMMGDRPNGGQTRKGPGAEGFTAVDVLPRLTQRAVGWIREHSEAARAGQPFFLYLPLNAPHTPSLPTPEWEGKSVLNAYADFVMETDATVGVLLDAVAKAGVVENTVILFASDNGCSPQARIEELRKAGHDPCAGLRGTKADIWEGGHRIPLIVRWLGHQQAGTSSDALVCLTDLFATLAEITGSPVPASAGEDSISFVPALRGEASPRKTLISHSISGNFAIREGSMKLCLTPGSGGWSAPKPGAPAEKELPSNQLYDLAQDRAETRNLALEKPERVRELTTLLDKAITEGRTTSGPAEKNAVEVKMRKDSPAER